MKITVAFTGWLDASVVVRWLKQPYDAEGIALCASIGQRESLANVRRRALETGATEVQLRRRVAGLALPSLGSAGCGDGSSSFSSASSGWTP